MRQKVDDGRRGFFRALARELIAFKDEAGVVELQSLMDLRDAPDYVLAEMVPKWTSGRSIEVRQDGIYLTTPETLPTCVYLFGPHDKMMVDQYAGGRNIKTIADHTAQATGLKPDEAFQLARNLFAQLCRQNLCHPAAEHVWQ